MFFALQYTLPSVVCIQIYGRATASNNTPADPAAEPPPAGQPLAGFICESCGNNGWPKTLTPGSIWIELLLWCFLCFPGLIYSIWRLTARRKACPHCAGMMIPATSPRGRLLAQQLYGR